MTSLADPDILEALRSLYHTRRWDSTGICWNLEEALAESWLSPLSAGEWLSLAFNTLGLDDAYPVPAPGFSSNEDAYDMAVSHGSLHWLPGDPYAENRYHLLSLLIDLAEGKTRTPDDVCWPHP